MHAHRLMRGQLYILLCDQSTCIYDVIFLTNNFFKELILAKFVVVFVILCCECHNMNIHSAWAFCIVEGKGKGLPVLD